MDPRHQKRIKIIQQLYSYFFYPHQQQNFDKKSRQIINCQEVLNKYINQFSVKFKVEKISKIDLSILYLSIYELLIEKKEPPKVIIDEAVELSKKFGSERSYAFVNAILGKVYSSISEKSKKSTDVEHC